MPGTSYMLPFAGLAALGLAGVASYPWWPDQLSSTLAAPPPLPLGVDVPVSVAQPFTTAGFGILLLAAFLVLWRTLERRTEAQLAAYRETAGLHAAAAQAQITAADRRAEYDRAQAERLQAAYLAAATISEAQRAQWTLVHAALGDLRDQLSDATIERKAQVEELSAQDRADHVNVGAKLDAISRDSSAILAILADRQATARAAGNSQPAHTV